MNCLNAEKKQKSLSFVVLKIFYFYFCPDTYALPVIRVQEYKNFNLKFKKIYDSCLPFFVIEIFELPDGARTVRDVTLN